MLTSVVTVVGVESMMYVIGASNSVHRVHKDTIIVAINFMTANRIPFAWTSVILSG